MKYFIYFFLLLSLSISGCEIKSEYEKFKSFQYDKNTIYLFFRETNSKNGFISREYNVNNSSMTHIGIGYFNNSKLKILHIDNVKNNRKNDLIISTIDDFFSLKECEVLSGEVYKYKIGLSKEEMENFSKYVDSLYYESEIRFDKKIDFNKSKNLYCSTLVSKCLKKIIPEIYIEKTIKRELKPVHKFILGRDSINYIPVDYYINLPFFEKIQTFKN